jgi:hypothetical protein
MIMLLEIRVEETSFCEQKEAKKLYDPGAWGWATGVPYPAAWQEIFLLEHEVGTSVAMPPRQIQKSFLVLFCKKELLFLGFTCACLLISSWPCSRRMVVRFHKNQRFYYAQLAGLCSRSGTSADGEEPAWEGWVAGGCAGGF